MRKTEVRFECDPGLDHLEIVIRGPGEDENVTELMKRLSMQKSFSFTAFDDRGVFRNITPEEIILVSTSGRRTDLITADGNWHTRQSLLALEAELDANRFVRISRFELVNLDKVLRYDFTVAGTLRLELAGGMETWASRRCIPAIRKRMEEGR